VNVSGATVLVTGGTGFLGRQVVAELGEAGAEVVGVGSADADLRYRGEIDRLLEEVAPSAVVHLAAVTGGIGANRAQPGRFFYDNAIMGIELLESCRARGIEKVLVSGTVCSYPKYTPVPFREESLWDGYPEETNAPYGLAKKMLLVQSQAYRQEYGFNAIHLLVVNLYGPGDSFDLESSHVIPAMIRRFVEAHDSGASEVVLWGDGSPTREFIYVRDAASAIRLALEHYEGAAPVNIGSGREISIKELAETVADAVGYTGAIEWDTTKPNGQLSRRLETSKARDLFGFEAGTDFSDGLAETIAWYRALPGS
jgi:GDP-L-fucose synthase